MFEWGWWTALLVPGIMLITIVGTFLITRVIKLLFPSLYNMPKKIQEHLEGTTVNNRQETDRRN